MKRLPPSGYVTAEESRRPGYLAKRLALYRARVKAKADQDKANATEAEQKRVELKPRKRAA